MVIDLAQRIDILLLVFAFDFYIRCRDLESTQDHIGYEASDTAISFTKGVYSYNLVLCPCRQIEYAVDPFTVSLFGFWIRSSGNMGKLVGKVLLECIHLDLHS